MECLQTEGSRWLRGGRCRRLCCGTSCPYRRRTFPDSSSSCRPQADTSHSPPPLQSAHYQAHKSLRPCQRHTQESMRSCLYDSTAAVLIRIVTTKTVRQNTRNVFHIVFSTASDLPQRSGFYFDLLPMRHVKSKPCDFLLQLSRHAPLVTESLKVKRRRLM